MKPALSGPLKDSYSLVPSILHIEERRVHKVCVYKYLCLFTAVEKMKMGIKSHEKPAFSLSDQQQYNNLHTKAPNTRYTDVNRAGEYLKHAKNRK